MNRIRSLMAHTMLIMAFIAVPVIAHAVDLDPNLVGMWHMDGDWTDSSDVSNDGEPHAVTFSSNAKIGTAAGSFNGNYNYIIINPFKAFPTTELSAEFWINTADSTKTAGILSYAVLNRDNEFLIYNQNKLEIYLGTSVLMTDVSLNDGKWHHVVVTWRSSDGFTKIFKDGVLAYNGKLSANTSITSGGSLVIGSEQDSVGGGFQEHQWYIGLLDEVAIYNRALSDTEILEHYRKYIVKSPTVNPVPPLTAIPTVTLSGTKPANTAIVVNGNTLVPLDGATVWQTNCSLIEGTNDLTITALDSQNYSSLPVTLTVVLDTTPPFAPVLDPITSLINNSSISISGTKSSDSAGIVVSCEGATIDTIYYPTATTWIVNLSGLQEGSNTINAYAVDPAGNPSATATATITVDTTPPAVGATPPGGIYNSTKSVAITANEPAVIYYTLDGSIPTQSATMYSQPITIPVSATLKYIGRDLAGNTSEIVTEYYLIDTTPPVLSISTLSDGAYTNNETLNIAGTVTDDTELTGIMVNDTEVPVNPDGSFSYALLLNNGANTITITATDSAGNMAEETRTVTLDQTAPILTVKAPADNSKTGNVLLNVSGTVDKTSTVTVKMKDSVQSALMNGGDFTATIVLEPGYNTIEITATDLAGNQSSLKRTVLYDDQKPSLAIIEPNQDIRTNQSSLTIKGTVNDTLTTVGVAINMDDEIFTPPVIDGTFEQIVNFTEEKTYNIILTATNEVGTSSSVQRNVIYDITPPALSIDPVQSPTTMSSQSLKGTREAGTSVIVSCVTAKVGEVSYPTETTWQVNISCLREGKNVIKVASVDAAGNAVTASVTVVLSSRLPKITIKATPEVIWLPNHRMVPVKISGRVNANGCAIKSVLISVCDEYGKFNYKNLAFGRTVMLEAWEKANDRDGRKYTITVVVTIKGGITTSKTATVTVHNKCKWKGNLFPYFH